MIIKDDRTEEQKKTHTWLIAGTDRAMGNWGNEAGVFNGPSYAVWACPDFMRLDVLCWVERRGDLQRVREVARDYRPKGQGHCHIYVVGENHPAWSSVRWAKYWEEYKKERGVK